MDTYKQAELKPDATSKGRLLACLRLFEAGEPTRKKFVAEMIVYVVLCFSGHLFFVEGQSAD